MKLPFTKMNGAGNDFIIFDGRKSQISLSPEQIREFSRRDNPITRGCDQLLVLGKSDVADVFMKIYNADGGEVDACGNATRCIADMLYKELGRLPVTIQTNVAVLRGLEQKSFEGKDYILVDMGAPKMAWQDIPLAMPIEEAAALIEQKFGLKNPIFVNMGNPHVVFFLEFYNNPNNLAQNLQSIIDAQEYIEDVGSKLENYTEIFPERVNVTIAALYLNRDEKKTIHHIVDALVWERGAGLTKACGTAACAMMAAANKLSPTVKELSIWFKNSLQFVSVNLQENGHILLGGAVEKEFESEVEI